MTDIDAGCECRASGRHNSASHFLSSRPVDIRDDNGSALPGQFLAKRSANPRRTPRDDRNQILKWHETKGLLILNNDSRQERAFKPHGRQLPTAPRRMTK